MTYQFRPAVREQCFTLTGFAGPSGSGKTYSALRYATGLANGTKIAMIDTEARRGLHYADQFEYLYSELAAPFTPERYVEAIQAAEKAGAGVIIVDSMSHEHEGPGGVLEMHDTELTRMAGDDFRKREACKFAAWIKPKAAHNRFVNTVLQVKAHLIFCFRAKEKLKLVKNERGKMEPVQMGWQPICTDRLEYEMTALLMLPPNSKGLPDLNQGATKLQEQHRGIFATGQPIDEAMGRSLGGWAMGAAPAVGNGQQSTAANGADPIEAARSAARQGADALRAWWKKSDKAAHATINPHIAELQEIAAKADASGQEEEDPFGLPAEDHKTQSAPGDLEGSRPGAAAAVQGREQPGALPSGNRDGVTPAPAAEVAENGGQQPSGMLANLKVGLGKQTTNDALTNWLAGTSMQETVAGLSEDERATWRGMVESARGDLG